jgi:hypothetical protein
LLLTDAAFHTAEKRTPPLFRLKRILRRAWCRDVRVTLIGSKKFGETSMKASAICFQVAVLFVLTGMVWGLQMAISKDHSAFPAHAHLNLLGWVSLFLFGIYYRLNPTVDRTRAALVQVGVWSVGVVIMAVGVGLVAHSP